MIPENSGQPQQKSPSKKVPAAPQSIATYSPREGEIINNEQPPERFAEGEKVLLTPEELVGQVGAADGIPNEDNAEEIDNDDTSPPSRHAPKETSSISPIPSTSKKVHRVDLIKNIFTNELCLFNIFKLSYHTIIHDKFPYQ